MSQAVKEETISVVSISRIGSDATKPSEIVRTDGDGAELSPQEIKETKDKSHLGVKEEPNNIGLMKRMIRPTNFTIREMKKGHPLGHQILGNKQSRDVIFGRNCNVVIHEISTTFMKGRSRGKGW